MPPKSSIFKLPSEIREYIAKIREEGSTLDEIIEAVQEEFEVDIKRSTLGRYTQHVDRVTKKLRDSRFMAESIAKHMGDKPTSQVARANIELLHSIIMDILVLNPEDGDDAKVNSGDAMKIAIALEKLTKAHKTDTDRDLQVAKEAERKAKEEAMKAVENVAKRSGISADSVLKIKKEILGAG